MTNEHLLDISWKTILKISLAALCLYVLYLIRDILIWFIFALIISILFNPVIDFLQRKKIPRALSVVFIYVGFLGLIGFLFYYTASMFFSEVQQFSQVLPQYFERIAPPLRGLGFQAFENIESFINTTSKTLEEMAGSIFNTLFYIFGGIFSTFFVIIVAMFLSFGEKGMEKNISALFPKKYQAYALNLWKRCQKKISSWFIARILACIFVGLVSYFAFLILNVKYPFSLGLFAGIFNFVPMIGPIIAGLIIFLMVGLDSILKAGFVLIAFILIQQIECNILTPILTKKIVGLSPVLVLVALAIGGKLWGALGAVLAIPIAGILSEFFKDFLEKKEQERTIVI